ncbi:MAG: efflux RND transporter periplasmic adaptor subunit [Lentisphaeria bacterium]|nr:efflux RND transporter periplasmic adaptor subunit [Lentisphaeria bacterium]NQZ68597.1 efflux RND transporter periplasmic adaptor subunit [Lentisphaeria bacterium]
MKVLFLFLFVLLAYAADTVEAITRPSKDVSLSFITSGLIDKVLIKEGDSVKAGQLLAQLNSDLERNKIAQLKAQLENDAKLKGEKAKLEQSDRDVKHLKKALESGAGIVKELEHAQLTAKTSVFTIEQLNNERNQIKIKLEESKLILNRLIVKAPVSGQVEQVLVSKGETAEPQKPVIRIVQINPLWVDVPVPLKWGRRLKKGNQLMVHFPASPAKPKGEKRQGKIIFVSSVADAGSETLRIRLEVPNPDKRFVGERVSVVINE